MKQIGARLFGDAENFSFEHRMFNFGLLLGIFMTFFGAIVDFISFSGGLLWFVFGAIWLLLYYLSRVKRYFKVLAIFSFSLLILVFFPYSWFYGDGSYGVFPYYALLFIAIVCIILSGRARWILALAMIAVVLLLIGVDYHSPGLIVPYNKVLALPSLAINLTITMVGMAVFLIIYSNTYMNEKARSEKYARTIAEHYQQQSYYMANLERLIFQLKAERHDFNNHLGVIYGLLECGEIDAVMDYTRKLVDAAAEFQSMVYVPYSIVRAMLNYKLSSAKENRIALRLKINIPEGLKLNEFDLTVILGNLLDNAIEACAKLEEKSRYIDLSILYKPDYLVVQVENPLNATPGYPEGNRTTKTDNANHGFGLKNIEYLVNKHHGLLEIKRENGVFRVQIALLTE